MAAFPGAPLVVGVGAEVPEVVWFPAEEVPEVTVEDAAEVVEAGALEDLESPVVVASTAAVVAVVAVEAEVAAATRTPAEVVSLIPQTDSESKVKGMFLALQSLFCRVTESEFISDETWSKRESKSRNKEKTYQAAHWSCNTCPCSRSMPRGTSVGHTCMLRRWCRTHRESCRSSNCSFK
jgi:hypothetical protein